MKKSVSRIKWDSDFFGHILVGIIAYCLTTAPRIYLYYMLIYFYMEELSFFTLQKATFQ